MRVGWTTEYYYYYYYISLCAKLGHKKLVLRGAFKLASRFIHKGTSPSIFAYLLRVSQTLRGETFGNALALNNDRL